MVGEFGKMEQQYECVTKFGLVNQDDALKIQHCQDNGRLYAQNSNKEVLYQLLLNAGADAGKKKGQILATFARKTDQAVYLSRAQEHWHDSVYAPEMFQAFSKYLYWITILSYH